LLALAAWAGFWSIPYVLWLHMHYVLFLSVFALPGFIGIVIGLTMSYLERRELIRQEFRA
jgi:hypothetical protein